MATIKHKLTKNKLQNMTNKEKENINGRDELGRFIKGRISERKGKPYLRMREENHPNWKGGTHATARRLAIRYGIDLTKCEVCNFILTHKYLIIEDNKPQKKYKSMCIHHIDGNEYNNERKNLMIVCHFCHNAIHDNNNKRATRFQNGHLLNQHKPMEVII